MDMLQQHSM